MSDSARLRPPGCGGRLQLEFEPGVPSHSRLRRHRGAVRAALGVPAGDSRPCHGFGSRERAYELRLDRAAPRHHLRSQRRGAGHLRGVDHHLHRPGGSRRRGRDGSGARRRAGRPEVRLPGSHHRSEHAVRGGEGGGGRSQGARARALGFGRVARRHGLRHPL